MKTRPALALALLACVPALMAQEPATTPPGPPLVLTNSIPAQEDLAEHAALVEQIGETAAKGFDAEVHARALRQQIEAVMNKGATKPVSTAPPTPATPPPDPSAPTETPEVAEMPAKAGPVADVPTHSHDLALRQAIQKLRAVLAELERQLAAGAAQH